MAAVGEHHKPAWQPAAPELSAPCRRELREDARLSALAVLFITGGAAALLIYFLTSNSSPELIWALVVVALGLPVLAARLLNKQRREQRLGVEGVFHRAGVAPAEQAPEIPAGLLVVSQDMRVHAVNDAFLSATRQKSEDVLGWQLEDVLPAAGLENQARNLLNRPYIATSCSFTTLRGRQTVSITMTRIQPTEQEERVLVVVEDFLYSMPLGQHPLVEGYIC